MKKKFYLSFIACMIICSFFLVGVNLKADGAGKNGGYIFDFSSSKVLKNENINCLDLKVLKLARNEIYARHGYVFKDAELRSYFQSKKWYKANKKYDGKLNQIEKKNVDMIQNYEKYLSSNKYNDDFNKEWHGNKVITRIASFDLNGDGKLESIEVVFKTNQEEKYTLKINNKTISGTGENIYPRLNIVDIDLKDNIREIAIEEEGPSDDCETTFYYYNGKDIIKVGKVSGLCGSYKRMNGKGLVLAETRFSVLQTWYYDDEYKLGLNHKLQHIAKKLYKTSYKSYATMLKSLTLYKNPGSKDVVIKLKVGEKIELIGSDDKAWCAVKTQKGQIGWFEVSGFNKIKELNIDANEVFKGLCNAD